MIQVGFSTHKNSLISWVIRKITKSRASHSWILLDEEYFGTKMVFEAVGIGGFRLVTYDFFKSAGNEVIALIDPEVPLDPGVQEAVKWLGTPYDKPAFFGYFFVLVGRWLKLKWRNPVHSAQSQFCSEAVVRVLLASKHPGTEDMDPESTTPQDILDFFAGRGRAPGVGDSA